MHLTRARQLFRRFTAFQIAVAGLLLFCLGLQIVTLVALLRTRAETRPVVSRSDALVELADQGPYIREALVRGLLALAVDELAELAQSRLHYTVHISQTVPFSTAIAVNERFVVPTNLVVSQTLPVKAAIPFQGEVLVPVNLEIDQVFAIDTSVPFQEEIVVPVDDVIHIDERFRVRLLGQDFSVPIRGDIPVQLDVTVPINKEFPVQADIPVAFPISETLPVEIDWSIPVDLELPVRLPVETEVSVPFSRIIPVNVQVPLVLDVPIDIAIGETPFGQYLLALSEQLRQVVQEDR